MHIAVVCNTDKYYNEFIILTRNNSTISLKIYLKIMKSFVISFITRKNEINK